MTKHAFAGVIGHLGRGHRDPHLIEHLHHLLVGGLFVFLTRLDAAGEPQLVHRVAMGARWRRQPESRLLEHGPEVGGKGAPRLLALLEGGLRLAPPL